MWSVVFIPLWFAACAFAQEPASFTIAGEWEVRVDVPGKNSQRVHVIPPVMITVTAEKYTALPMFNPKAGGWVKGAQLNGVKAQETTSPHLIEPGSFTLRAGPEPDAPVLAQGADYEFDADWARSAASPAARSSRTKRCSPAIAMHTCGSMPLC